MAPTSLSINCTPTHGVVPWTATLNGNLNAGVPVAGASVYLQYYDANASAWYNVFDSPAVTDSVGAYTFAVLFEERNGWVAGMTGTLRTAFLGDGVNDASVSASVTVTMDGGGGGASTLTFSCLPLSGTIPWDSVITGKLSNTSGGIPNAVVEIQYIGVDGVTWYPTGITTITDAFGNYTTIFTFTLANGWTPGSTGTLRASFAGDTVNGAGNSLPVTVTMNQSGTNGYLSVSATVNGVAVPASVTADGQTGTTPVTFTFTPSTPTTYTVNATYQGVTLTRTAVVSAGQTATLAFDFTGGSPSLLIPAIVAFGVVSIALIATRKGGTKQKKKRRK